MGSQTGLPAASNRRCWTFDFRCQPPLPLCCKTTCPHHSLRGGVGEGLETTSRQRFANMLKECANHRQMHLIMSDSQYSRRLFCLNPLHSASAQDADCAEEVIVGQRICVPDDEILDSEGQASEDRPRDGLSEVDRHRHTPGAERMFENKHT